MRGWAVLRNTLDRHWFVADSVFNQGNSDQVYIDCDTDQPCDAIALRIDPPHDPRRHRRRNPHLQERRQHGWLFAHSNTGHHADHELQLMACIDGVFQPYFRQLHVDVIDGANLNIKQRATRLYSLLSQFYGEVIALARTNARAVLLGHRHREVHPAEGHLHSE